MTLLTALSGQPASLTDSAQGRHQRVYQQLHGETQDATELAREYLHDQLALVEDTDCDLPEAPEQLMAWGL